MSPAVSITIGQTYGRWTVVARGVTKSQWVIRCSCGTERTVTPCRVREIKGGGCKRCHMKTLGQSRAGKPPRSMLNLAGKKFGRLSVICFAGTKKTTKDGRYSCSQWLCRCSCGNEIVATAIRLKRKGTPSCGCVRREFNAKMCRRINRTYDSALLMLEPQDDLELP